jgi:2-polyprenyl-6-methoxyphenol hydroxylase-like FAD-dependent oxidoreductase
LRLANENIDVTILDMAVELDTKPRATHYASTAVLELNKAGVLDDIRALGFTPSGICWRKIDHTYLAGIKHAVVQNDPNRPVCLPLNKLGRILYDHISKCPTATVKWGHEVIGIEQDEAKARVICKSSGKEMVFEADYVVGCDGANSKVRRCLFGDWEFPGKTWDEQIVATNVDIFVIIC